MVKDSKVDDDGTFPEDGTMRDDVGSASAVIMTGEHSAHYFGV